MHLVQQSAPHREAAAQHIASEMVDAGDVVDPCGLLVRGCIVLYVVATGRQLVCLLDTWELAWFLVTWADPWAADCTWRWHNTKKQRCIHPGVYSPVLYTSRDSSSVFSGTGRREWC